MATTQTTTTMPAGYVLAAKPNTIAPALTERTRSYKDFLTSALHHRFRRACYLVLGVCLVESLLMRWNWLSFTGIRALLLFMSCLAVFIVRVANMHVGVQTRTSSAESVYKATTSWRTAHTLGWYAYSAWFFGEVYLWSRSESANLGWVDHGRTYESGLWERPMLNENPIFLRTLWLCLALAQASLHLARGEDRIRMSDKQVDTTKQQDASPSATLLELWEHTPTILGHILRLLIPTIALTLPIYLIFIRHLLWPYYHTIGRLFFSSLPDHSRPTGLQRRTQLTWQALSSSFTLLLLWQVSNAVFTVFVSKPPIRRDQPLTTEVKDGQGNILNRSKDPNGSLLGGLKSKKEVTKSFAFWELSIICSQFESRRKTIYTEVDRADGSTWSQISQLCLNEIVAVQARIRDAQAPAPQPTQPQQQPSQAQQPTLSLPRIATRNVVENGDLFARSSQQDLAHRVGDMAKSIGQNPNASQNVHNRARRAIEWSADRVLTKQEQQRLSRETLTQEASSTLMRILRSSLGEPFRQTFARRARAIVFGTPYSKRADIVHASEALSILCVHSIKEDDYAQVARSVPSIVRTYTAVINGVVNFVATLPPHWTDVSFDGRKRRVREVEELLDVLKAGLEGVVLAFGEYADSVGITKKELREAKEALGKGMEMKEV